MYQLELIWNREFNWSRYGKPFDSKKAAINFANAMLYSGNGERVKKVRVLNEEEGVVFEMYFTPWLIQV